MSMEKELKKLADKVKFRCKPMPSGCLEWQGAKSSRGYGVVYHGGRHIATHRVALAAATNMPELLKRIDRGASVFAPQYVLHSCDNPSCCNPRHLRLGTATDNSTDMVSRNRHRAFNSKLPRKLTPEAVKEIRIEAQTWDGLCDMMKKHKVGQMTINEVLQRKTYKYVD